jgi:hypothetical protein
MGHRGMLEGILLSLERPSPTQWDIIIIFYFIFLFKPTEWKMDARGTTECPPAFLMGHISIRVIMKKRDIGHRAAKQLPTKKEVLFLCLFVWVYFKI